MTSIIPKHITKNPDLKPKSFDAPQASEPKPPSETTPRHIEANPCLKKLGGNFDALYETNLKNRLNIQTGGPESTATHNEGEKNIAYYSLSAKELEQAISNHFETKEADNRNSAVLIFKGKNGEMHEDLQKLYAVALFKAGYITKEECDKVLNEAWFSSSVKILKKGIGNVQKELSSEYKKDSNKIGEGTREILFDKLRSIETQEGL